MAQNQNVLRKTTLLLADMTFSCGRVMTAKKNVMAFHVSISELMNVLTKHNASATPSVTDDYSALSMLSHSKNKILILSIIT